MAITFVGMSSWDSTYASTNPSVIHMPSGIAKNDVLLAISPGSGGTGARHSGVPGGQEADQWMAWPVPSNGHIGNQFNIHDGLWTRWRSEEVYDLRVRNQTGSGVMMAFRGINWNSLGSLDSIGDAGATSSGTLVLPAKTNTATSGKAMSFVIGHQRWSNAVAPFTHCTFDFSGHPELSYCGEFFNTNGSDYMSIWWEVRDAGDNFPALSVPYSNAQPGFSLDTNLARIWSSTNNLAVAQYGV